MSFNKLLLATAIAAASSAAFAMEAMDEAALSETTGQDGLTITITPPAGGITADIVVHDIGGYTGATSNGAIVIGDPLNPGSANSGTHDSFNITAAGGIVLDVDASGDVNSVTAGNQPGLRVAVSLPTGMTLTTGDISVAASGAAYALTNQTADILNSMSITIGSGTVATVNLGNEPNGGAMIQLNATLTGGLSIANFALNDASGTGSINAVSINMQDTGAGTNLTTNIAVNATATGLAATVNTLGGANGVDITMVDVGLGNTTSLGDVQVIGLNLVGTTITVAGH